MNGKITVYCRDVSAGVICDNTGRHYLFNLKEWKSGPHAPRVNTEVFFERINGWAFDVKLALMPPEVIAKALALPRRMALPI